jgi:hypothetical protein
MRWEKSWNNQIYNEMWDGSTECTILLIKLIYKMINLVFEIFDIPQFYLVFKKNNNFSFW